MTPKKKLKEQKEKLEKFQAREREMRSSFRKEIHTRINRFVQNDTISCFRFEPMDKLQRSIVHEVAETGGLVAFSFGIEGDDRFVMLFKKEASPTDEQLAMYRSGLTYDPREVDDIIQKRRQEKKQSEEEVRLGKRKSQTGPVPSSDYHAKYRHLIGVDSAAAAAQSLHANNAYGFVSSENKKDKRSIEQTLADIRSKKKVKGDDDEGQTDEDHSQEGESSNKE